MAKRNSLVIERLRKSRRELDKFLKERRKNKKLYSASNRSKLNDVYIKNENTLFDTRKDECLSDFGFLIMPGQGVLRVKIPSNFSMCTNYPDVMRTAKIFASSIYDYPNMIITLDFSDCQEADVAALFFLQVIRLEMLVRLESFQKRLKYVLIVPQFSIALPKSSNVCRLLVTSGYPVDKEYIDGLALDTTFNPNSTLGYYKGRASQKHVRENRKGVCASRVVDFINHCISQHGYELTAKDRGNFDGLILEVLSNCEDHSKRDTWFLTANFSTEKKEEIDQMVGELNIAILNFGESFYEGFLSSKKLNHEVFNEIDESVNVMLEDYPSIDFEKEQLFSLLMMSDGISRLTYRDDSRGTGTIKLINSFLELGDYEEKERGLAPNLSIFTGKTHLICNNEYKPFVKDNVYLLSLNPEMDFNIPPRKTHLRKLGETFPGTLLSAKIYLNKGHLDKKYGGNHEND